MKIKILFRTSENMRVYDLGLWASTMIYFFTQAMITQVFTLFILLHIVF